MPNAGVPREIEGRNFYLCSPEYMAEYAKRFILSGVRIIGGCCGTTPAHTRAMVAAVRALEPPCRQAARTATCQDQGAVGSQVAVSEKSQLARRLADGGFAVSVEIVPPRGHDSSRAVAAARMLKEHGVDCVNIPDGPRATARMSPMALASILVAEAGIEPLLHYTCRDRNLLGMQSDLLGVFAQGIRNLLIITGDPPKLGDYPDATAVFDVDSIGLAKAVALLNRGIDIGGRKLSPPTAFLIGVGANPGALNRDHEISRFRRKVEAGAEFAITQPVFDATVLEDFLESIKGFQVPILAGIWPLVSLRNAEFMRNEVPGASVPDSVMERMRRAQDRGPEAAREEGIAIARETIRMVKGLVQGVQISPPQGNYDLVARALEGQ
jgi:homocysteine S-methyltransferase